MTIAPETTTQNPVKRPGLVWVVSIFYVISVGYSILSLLLIFSGVIPLNEVVKQYYRSLTVIDYLATILIGTSNIIGAVLLFVLRKRAFHFFVTAFSISVILAVYETFATNWLSAMGVPGMIGQFIGWMISVAIILYTKSLIDQGILT